MSKTASRGREQCWRAHTDTGHGDACRNIIYPRKQKGIRGTFFFLKLSREVDAIENKKSG